jgi:hypothetical protein
MASHITNKVKVFPSHMLIEVLGNKIRDNDLKKCWQKADVMDVTCTTNVPNYLAYVYSDKPWGATFYLHDNMGCSLRIIPEN